MSSYDQTPTGETITESQPASTNQFTMQEQELLPEAAKSQSQTSQRNLQNGPPSVGSTGAAETIAAPSSTDLLLAATLIIDAKYGRNINFKTDEKSIRLYQLYHHWGLRWALYFFIALNLALAIFEEPAVENMQAPYWATILVEFVCLGYFIFRISHAAKLDNSETFVRDTKNVVVVAVIALTIIDIFCYIIWKNVSPLTHPVRWSRPLRPLFIVNFSDGKQIRRAFRNIRRTVPDILNVLILFVASILLFGLLALKLFSKRSSMTYPGGKPYFKTYLDSIWDLYVLVTTANNPDVMLPAYDTSNWFALFFIIYLVICLYIFMSIVLAAIYNNFKKNLKNEVRMAVYSKRQKLAHAFDILKTRLSETELVLTQDCWKQVMKLVAPRRTPAQTDLLFKVLDTNNTHYIHKREFLRLTDLLQLDVTEVQDRQNIFEHYIPWIYNSRPSKLIRFVVRHRYFRYAFDLLIFVNAWFIGFDVDQADWFFLSMFMLEIFLKLYSLGVLRFFSMFWNIFDFFVIFTAVFVSIGEETAGASEQSETLDIILVLRVMRLVKLFVSIHRFKVILMTVFNIGPSIVTYGGVIFVFYYFYAIIGMEVYGGKIQYYGYNVSSLNSSQLFCGNPSLNGSQFYAARYCNNNFNNILKAFVVLFELTVVNQWHVLSEGFALVTHQAAKIYFLLFHLNCVVIVLNIFTAFILEAFILEYSLQRIPRLESEVEKKIRELGLNIEESKRRQSVVHDDVELVNNEQETSRNEESDSDDDSLPDISEIKGTRFHLKKKSHKKVEVLLHQMFENEIDAEDAGPSFSGENFYLPEKPIRRPTLETVT